MASRCGTKVRKIIQAPLPLQRFLVEPRARFVSQPERRWLSVRLSQGRPAIQRAKHMGGFVRVQNIEIN